MPWISDLSFNAMAAHALRTLLEIAWLFLPAGLANTAPVIAARLFPTLDAPVDAGVRLGGVRLFGDHKTVRGMVAGTVVGAGVFAAQQALDAHYAAIHALGRFDYAGVSWTFGAALGLGALTGDLVKSFFKRRVGRAPGQSWIPFDQIDWMLGALLVLWYPARLDLFLAIVACSLAFVVSLIVKRVGYWAHLDAQPI